MALTLSAPAVVALCMCCFLVVITGGSYGCVFYCILVTVAMVITSYKHSDSLEVPVGI